MSKYLSANLVCELPKVEIIDGIVFTTVDKGGKPYVTCLTINMYMRHHRNVARKLAEWSEQQDGKIAPL